MKRMIALVAFVCLAAPVASAVAAVPRTLSIQGVLRGTDGDPVPDGAHETVFGIYGTAEGGEPLWTETLDVTTAGGVFSAILGETTPLDLDFGAPAYVGIRMTPDPEFTPRIPLTAVPYSLTAASVEDGAVTGAKLAAGAVGSDALAEGAVTGSRIADGAVTEAKLADGSVTGFKLSKGAVTGDKLASGAAVTALNGLAGPVYLRGAGGTSVSAAGDTLVVTSILGEGGTGIQGVRNTDGTLALTDPNGPVATIGLKDGGVPGSKLTDASVAGAKLADGSVDEAKLADNAVTGSKLASGAVNGAKLAVGAAVTSVNGLADAVTLAAGDNVILDQAGHTITIHATGGGAADTAAWRLGGNLVADPVAQYLGTSNDVPLEVRVDGKRALRLEPEVDAGGDFGTGRNLIGGSEANSVIAGVAGATIAGGGASGAPEAGGNRVSAHYGTVAGGAGNMAGGDSDDPTDGPFAAVGGGKRNLALGWGSTVGGGDGNTAASTYTTIGGGTGNVASGFAATVPGGNENEAHGANSFAAGLRARVRPGDDGTFVWADGIDRLFESTGPNQFLVRAGGGVGINTGDPRAALHVGGVPGVDGIMFPDGTLQTTAAGTTGAAWSLAGNAGTDPSTQFLGTTDDQALELRVNGERGLRLEPGPTPNVIGGSAANSVDHGAIGATIGGGGEASVYPNRISDDYGTVSGGRNNRAGDDSSPGNGLYATVGGGESNIAGGKHSFVGGGEADSATADWAVVAGGLDNRADDYAFVGGGQGNKALGPGSAVAGGASNDGVGTVSVIGGGLGNTAEGGLSIIVGGSSNLSSGYGSVVVGGGWNRATGNWSFVGNGGSGTFQSADANRAEGDWSVVTGGSGNLASGKYASVPGGRQNTASGYYSFAGGRGAQALHFGCFVWSVDQDIDQNVVPFPSTGDRQFLIRARGGVGIGTNAPREQLHVLDPNGGTGIMLGGNGAAGPNGIIFDDDTPDQGVQLLWRTSPNRLVLERTSEGTGTDGDDAFFYDRDDEVFHFNGKVGVGTDSPATGFHVQGNPNGAASIPNHVAVIENTSTGTSPDVLALKVGTTTPGASVNFISFVSASNSAGAIQGDGAGGVTLGGPGSDYAEWMPREDPSERLEPGEVVGVHGGAISRRTAGAAQVMVVSRSPLVLGNRPDVGREAGYEKIAFIGQVGVKVEGPVRAGDAVVASGWGDGTARAMAPGDLTPEAARLLVGTAWESNSDDGVRLVRTAVGTGASVAALSAALAERERRLGELERQMTDLLARVSRIEAVKTRAGGAPVAGRE